MIGPESETLSLTDSVPYGMNSERDPDSRHAARGQSGRRDRTGVFVVSADPERRDAFAVRRTVFVDEQGVDEEIEWDEHDEPDADATHFVAYDDGDVVGAARFRVVEGDDEPVTGKVERVAVARTGAARTGGGN